MSTTLGAETMFPEKRDDAEQNGGSRPTNALDAGRLSTSTAITSTETRSTTTRPTSPSSAAAATWPPTGPKPYYSDALVAIYLGDCREILPSIEADVIVTDPPYGTGAYATDKTVLTGAMLAAWPHAAVFGWPERLVALCMDAARVPDEWVVWWPTNKPGARTPGLSRESEHIAVFGKVDGSAVMRRRSPNATGRAIATLRGNDPDWARDGDVWRDPSPFAGFLEGRLHPNEKPVGVMRKLALMMPVGTILDPFMGSGSTLVAAKSLGRRAIGIEIEERYCEIAANRCRQEVLGLGA